MVVLSRIVLIVLPITCNKILESMLSNSLLSVITVSCYCQSLLSVLTLTAVTLIVTSDCVTNFIVLFNILQT